VVVSQNPLQVLPFEPRLIEVELETALSQAVYHLLTTELVGPRQMLDYFLQGVCLDPVRVLLQDLRLPVFRRFALHLRPGYPRQQQDHPLQVRQYVGLQLLVDQGPNLGDAGLPRFLPAVREEPYLRCPRSVTIPVRLSSAVHTKAVLRSSGSPRRNDGWYSRDSVHSAIESLLRV
jgi:hypothetical protein